MVPPARKRRARIGWWLVPLVFVAIAVGVHALRVSRVERITQLGGAGSVVRDAASPTEYAHGVRLLLVPGQDFESYQWIAQTQQMLAEGELRVREVTYDNAPEGRTTLWASPVRWWLAAVGWVRTLVTDRSVALEVERAALWANPLLHLLVVAGIFWVVVRRFGWLPAVVAGAAATLFYPFVAAFPAAQPNELGLALLLAMASLWVLIAAVEETTLARATPGAEAAGIARGNARRIRNRAVVAGVLGALALWVKPGLQVGFVVGLAAGVLAHAAVARRSDATGLWRVWGLAGAVGTLAVYFVEFAPGYLGEWHLEAVHPLYGLAWVGLGDALERCVRAFARGGGGLKADEREQALGLRGDAAAMASVGSPLAGAGSGTDEREQAGNRSRQRERGRGRLRRWIGPVVDVVAIASLPVALWKTDFEGWDGGLGVQRLSRLPGAPEAGSLIDWWSRDGGSLALVATVLPVLLLALVAIAAWKRRGHIASAPGPGIALVAGPVLVWLLIAIVRLDAWAAWGAAMIALLALATAAVVRAWRATARVVWCAAVAAALLPSAALLLRDAARQRAQAVSEDELVALINRDLAHWLANRAGPNGANVLAPPVMTASLCYHGGLSGLGTPDPGNDAGFAAAVRIAGATSQDEAHALVQRRGVTHIVVPSWDPFLDEYARLGAQEPDKALVALLHQWLPPRWLRPVPYLLPTIEGFENHSAAVFEVVEIQSHVLALSRLADTFIELGRIDAAAAVAQALEGHFPNELGAWVARAQVHAARQDANGFREMLRLLLPAVERGDAANLPWDRQVALATVLAQARQHEAAKAIVAACVSTADERRLRSLGPGALYRLFALQNTYGVNMSDPALRGLAGSLLPPEVRAELGL